MTVNKRGLEQLDGVERKERVLANVEVKKILVCKY